MSDDRIDVTRRQLLRGAVAVAAVSAFAPSMNGCAPAAPAAPIDVGAVTAFAVGSFTTNGQLIIARDAGGLYAYSSVCPHQGCPVPAPASATAQSICPCHSTHFDANGDVQPGGETTQNLPHYSVAINSGRVIVDTSVTLTDRAARTVVPA